MKTAILWVILVGSTVTATSQTRAPRVTVYNTSSDYHHNGAPHDGIGEWRTVAEIPLRDAINAGRKACPICHPEKAPEFAEYFAAAKIDPSVLLAGGEASKAAMIAAEKAATAAELAKPKAPVRPPDAAARANAGAVVLATGAIDGKLVSDVLWVADGPMPVRQDPKATSPIIWTMKALEIARIVQVIPGAVEVACFDAHGWIVTGGVKNFLPDSSISSAIRIEAIKRRSEWTVAARFAIASRSPQIGFTREQLDLALGDPIRETEEQTASGTETTLVYPGRVVVVKAGKVSRITTVK